MKKAKGVLGTKEGVKKVRKSLDDATRVAFAKFHKARIRTGQQSQFIILD